MKNFIMNKKYLWINIFLMFITYGIWIIIYFYLKNVYKNEIPVTTSNITSFSLNVAGVTFDNEDGTSRQKLIENLHVGQKLKLVPYLFKNTDAVYVKTLNNKILGNIPSKHVKQIIDKLSKNLIKDVVVKEVEKFTNEDNQEIYYLKIKFFVNKKGK